MPLLLTDIRRFQKASSEVWPILSVTLAPTGGGTLRVRLAEEPIGLPFDVSLPDGMDIRWDSTGIVVGEHRTQLPEPGRYLWDAGSANWRPID